MATLEKLQTRIAKLQSQAEALVAKQSSGVIEKIRELMDKHGLTAADIEAHKGGGKRGRKPGSKAIEKVTAGADAKYRDPKSGATWSGRGRAPAWIASAKDRTRFLIGAGASSEPRPVAAAKKPGKYPRGPQPAKYRDPKTGATWSGRGPAPTWLAGAKDRAAFLIDGAAPSGESKPTAAKKVVSKKVGAKKVASKSATAKKAPPKKSGVQTASTATTKKAPAKKAAAKKVPAKKVSSKKAAKKAVVRRAKSETASVVTELPSTEVAVAQAVE